MPTRPPVAPGDRIEFVSREWLAEVARFLRERATALGAELDGVRTSLCEVHTHVPPHLAWHGDRAAFWIRLSGTDVEVGEGEVDDVDYKVTGSYNHTLSLATTVLDGDRERSRWSRRELDHRHGVDAIVEQGRLDQTPAVRRLLGDLHDHMARRTVNNPDLAHRIEHLGLARHRDELDTQGYTILEGAITEDYADRIRTALEAAIDQTSGPGSHGLGPEREGSAGRLLEQGRIFEDTAQHPWLLALQEHVVGRGCLLSASLGFRKGAGEDTHTVHVDYPLIEEPFPAYTMVATSVFALDDFDDTSGPTLVVPGSFQRNRLPRRGDGIDELVPIHMPKGSIAIWRGNTWHSAQVRTAPGLRVTLHQTYCRLHMRPLDGYMDIDPAILERNSPQLTTLCGLDDLFEKSDAYGPYVKGASYAERHYLGTRVRTGAGR